MKKLSRKKVIVTAVALLLLLVVGLVAGKVWFGTPKAQPITAAVVREDLEESVLATGIVTASKTVAVGSQVTGQLQTLHVALGDRVKKGQLLAEIDPVLQKNTLRDAEAEVENLAAQKRSRQALLRQYELAYRRQSRMNARDAASRADLESAQAQLESTRYDIAALAAQIKKASIAVDKERANLRYFWIYAPMGGTVVSIDTEEGQTVVSTQSSTTILTLANLDTMTVKAKISEADVTRVKPGLGCYFTLLGDSDTRYYGRLRAVEPGPVSGTSSSSSSSGSSTSSSSAVYYYGLFEIPNREGKLKVSMTAQVTVVLNRAGGALSIPVAALGERLSDGRYRVKVLEGGEIRQRVVRTGISNNVQVQVLEGLRQGEKVVVGDSSSLPATDGSERMPPPGRH